MAAARRTDLGDETDDLDVGEVAVAAATIPLLAAVGAAQCLPRLVAHGRERIERRLVVARMIGEMTVKVANSKIQSAIRERSGGVTDGPPPGRARAEPRDGDAVHRHHDGTRDEPVDNETAGQDIVEVADAGDGIHPPHIPASDLPIGDYESLAASHVVRRLSALSAEELELVERFERSHRHRRTVLGKIAQLRASSPT